MSAEEDDVHICLRCNAEIKGLVAYVSHRQSNCSSQAEGDDGGEYEGEASEEEGAVEGFTLINEENEPTQVASENGDSEQVNSLTFSPVKRRGRKRKDTTPQPTSEKETGGSASKKSKQRQSSPMQFQEESGGDDDDGWREYEGTGDSPRRSSRRGIRISYTELLSGVDRSDAKVSGNAQSGNKKGLTPSPAKGKVPQTTEVKTKSSPTARVVGKATPKLENAHVASKTSPRVKANKWKGRKKKRARKGGNCASSLDGKLTLGEKVKLRAAAEKSKKNKKAHKDTEEQSDDNLEGDNVEKSDVNEENEEPADVIFIKDGKFYCNVCKIYCSSQKKIDIHRVTRKHAKKMGLPLTEDEEGSPEKNNTGSESDEEEKVFECETCQYKTKKEGQFERHMRSISHAERANIPLFACQKCHRKYKTEEEWQAHQEFHTIPRCLQCKESFSSKEELNEHMEETGHRVENRCPECDKTFSSKGNLTSHMRGHDPSKRFRCDMCEYTTVQLADMKKHKYRHIGFKPFRCGLCEFECLTKNGMERHMKTHMVRSKDVECDECGSKFYDELLMRQHKYMKHNPERRFPCEFEGCTFSFKYRSSLLTHQRMHTQEKPYLCSECGYATSTKYSLTKHIRLHTGEKPFHCDFPNCTYSCRLSTHLSRHKIIHTGAKPFQCPFCSYACNNKQNLRKHLLTTKAHKGVMMYKCKTCPDYSTNSFRDYVVHIRTLHADDDKYISYFEVAESVSPSTGNMAAVQLPVNEEGEAIKSVEKVLMGEDGMETISVVTVVPGTCKRRRGRKKANNQAITTIMDDRDEVQKKLEEVILALEDTAAEMQANVIAGEEVVVEEEKVEEGDASGNAVPIHVHSLTDLVNLAAKDLSLGGEGDTIVIVPEVQTETEISTSEMTGVVTTGEEVTVGDAGQEGVQQFVVEIDQQGRLVSEEDMAAATWLHSMGTLQDVTVETVIQEETAIVEESQE